MSAFVKMFTRRKLNVNVAKNKIIVVEMESASGRGPENCD